MVFSVFPVYYGLELPRVISVNMARRIPTLFWYVSPKSPPQYQKKKSVQTFGGAYLQAYTVELWGDIGPMPFMGRTDGY